MSHFLQRSVNSEAYVLNSDVQMLLFLVTLDLPHPHVIYSLKSVEVLGV